jgi:hypothetical protein
MQIQAQTGVHKSMVQIVREAGFRGLYVGLPAIFLRDIPFNMLYFSSYAGFKKALRDENGEVSGVGVFVSGLGAGAIAGLFVFFFFFFACFSTSSFLKLVSTLLLTRSKRDCKTEAGS